MARDALEQYQTFLRLIGGGLKLNKTGPVYGKVLDFLRSFPVELSVQQRERLSEAVSRCFNVKTEEMQLDITKLPPLDIDLGAALDTRLQLAKEQEQELRQLIKGTKFLQQYVAYTDRSEAPLAYHVFCALVGIGAQLGRQIWFDMAYFKIYPPLGVLIIGPSGVKKTSAADIIVNMLREIDKIRIYSEKITPEALVESMKQNAEGLIYAPEMTVFLGKQDYLRGLVPLLTRLLDSPDHWSSETIMRQKATLENVGLSSLMCSTTDWFVKNTPADMFGGGFIARNLIVVQTISPRIIPIPQKGDSQLRIKIMQDLAQLADLNGEAIFEPGALSYFETWYVNFKRSMQETPDEILGNYYNRKHVMIMRIGMCLHAVEHGNLKVCEPCVRLAVSLLDWVEQFLPALLAQMFKSSSGEEHAYVLKIIEQNGGILEHSKLVRRTQHRLASTQLKVALQTMVEGGLIEEVKSNVGHSWIVRKRLTAPGEENESSQS